MDTITAATGIATGMIGAVGTGIAAARMAPAVPTSAAAAGAGGAAGVAGANAGAGNVCAADSSLGGAGAGASIATGSLGNAGIATPASIATGSLGNAGIAAATDAAGIAAGSDTDAAAPTAASDAHALQRLLDELGRLPGIGPKSAQRIAYHLLEADVAEARRLATALLDVKRAIHFCPVCFNYATGTTCAVCADASRDASTICVVSEPRDVTAIERTGVYHGLYHVLGGVISPMDKVGPNQLHIRELIARLAAGSVSEVILATNPDVEGETTATYLARTIAPLGVAVSRLASGLPVGGELEYADEVTLGRAIEARRSID